VRLPERRDLARERVLDLDLPRLGQERIVELGEKLGEAQGCDEHGPARRLGRMRGEDELERDPLLDQLLRYTTEPVARVRDRPPPDAALVRVLPWAPHAVMLLGDVREREVEREGAKHARLPFEGQFRDRVAKLVERGAPAGLARKCADTLDVGEER